MNKMYLAIIGFLLVIALLVGGYAFYKAANQTPINYPPTNANPKVQQTPETPATKSAAPKVEIEPEPAIPLAITSFRDGDIVNVAKFVVKGETTPNAEVSINEIELKADASGIFSGTITLEEGDNAIEVVSSDETGTTSYWEGSVTYEPKL